ncbi:MAG TPA: hypothetical protein VJI33_02820 [Candidatus Paceibacterota bacterium]
MRPNPKLLIQIISSAVIAIALFSYIYFQFKDYLLGPVINISHPATGSIVYGPEVEIRGTALRISSLSLNDSPIFTDTGGAFKEKLMLPSGYNIMKIEARDRFGKQTTKLLEFTVTIPN